MKTTENRLFKNGVIQKTKFTIASCLIFFSTLILGKKYALKAANTAFAVATLKTFELLTNFSL